MAVRTVDPIIHDTREPDALEIVAALYRAVEEPDRLGEAMRLFGEVLGSDCTQLVMVSTDTARIAEIITFDTAPGTRYSDDEWLQRWERVDFPVSLLRSNPAGRIFRCGVDIDIGSLASTTFRAHLMDDTGFADAIAAVVSLDARHAAVLVQFRSAGRARFDSGAAETVSRLLPHVARACRMRSRMATYEWAASPTRLLNLLPVPCMLTDDAGRCLDRNEALEDAMNALDMKIAHGRARFNDSYLQDSWQAALNEVRLTAVPTALLASSEEGRQWKVHLTPMELLKDGVIAADKPLILVVMEERSSSDSAAANSLVAASTRNLTPAENEVLSGLMRGHTAKLIARARGASVNTVRSQITTILEKTGHHTQKELIASFGSSTFGSSSFGFDGFSVSRPSSMARAGGQTPTATAARR